MSTYAVLYVKSEKSEQVEFTMPHTTGGGHWCSAGYRAARTHRTHSKEDEEGMQLLEEAGISYRLVDLADASVAAQLRARIMGVNKTPTLLYGGKKYKGLEEIKAALSH